MNNDQFLDSTTVIIQTALSDPDILKCWPAMYALRPHLLESEFLSKIKGFQTRGYTLVFVEENGLAASVAGFRFLEHLLYGKILYIDDLSTLPEHRGKGHGSQLLDWIFDYAKAHHCDEVHLDSGHQRFDAHRLYLNKGFRINSHHFAKKLV
jgi:GNAT superfamily N-acetyltransferase